MDRKVVVATRFFEKDQMKAAESFVKLQKFCQASLLSGAKQVLVAVNVDDDTSGAVCTEIQGAILFPVQPWGRFAIPLNAILVQGREYWAEGALLLSASVEVTLSKETVSTLVSHMDDVTLVVGAALLGHEYKRGLHREARGRETPWNTLALWNPLVLWNYGGFPILADGPLGRPEDAGVEEVITIASIQHTIAASPSNANCLAKLVEVPGQEWDTSGFDGERLAAHEKKMATKNIRPAAQLAVVSGVRAPSVTHI